VTWWSNTSELIVIPLEGLAKNWDIDEIFGRLKDHALDKVKLMSYQMHKLIEQFTYPNQLQEEVVNTQKNAFE
jgi:hypothetical protein